MDRTLLRGGDVVGGEHGGRHRADVLIEEDRIVAVGRLGRDPDAIVVDCDGRLVVPGLVDAHSHAEGTVFREDVQLALLRQGITTVIAGQDGVSYAPGDGGYATGYFAAINGPHPTYRGGGVARLLASYDGRVPVGVAYLVPAGTVRQEVMGADVRPANPEEIARMTALVAEGVEDGAVGLSTGLDYTPGIFADAAEIAALCAPVAAAGLPYVTHMRGGYEDNARAGVEEVATIGDLTGIHVHISHFHTPADEAWQLLDELEQRGIRTSFDAYPYTRGCTLLGMALLPPELNVIPPAEAAAALRDPATRARLRHDWFPRVSLNPSLGPDWPEMITIGHTPAPDFSWTHGATIAHIAEARGTDAVDAALDLLAASRLEVNAIMAVRNQRPVADLGRLLSHPRHLGGSDGIFIGAHPHPRAYGTFASYLGSYTRDHGFLDWEEIVGHLATAPVRLFRLGKRGRIQPGHIADIAVIDPLTVHDTASYTEPTRLAEGIDDVFVAGRRVLARGRLTGALPGGGIRATPTSRDHSRNTETRPTGRPRKEEQ